MKNYKTADEQYNEIVNKIINEGVMDSPEHVRTVYADGEKAPTKAIINVQMKFDNSTDKIPMITTKRVPQKDPIKELFWIWQLMSNDVNVLEEMGCKVWNEWKREDGSIRKAYGWQLRNKLQPVEVDDLFFEMCFNGKFSFKPSKEEYELGLDKVKEIARESEKVVIELNQVDYLLYMLQKNPISRRHKTTLWSVEDLHDMALQPCVYETHWQVFDGKLCLTVNIRSNDIALTN